MAALQQHQRKRSLDRIGESKLKSVRINRRAISPIIATLLLILIAIAAGVIVYAYVVGFIGNSTTNGGGSTNTLSMDQLNLASKVSNFPATAYVRNLGPSSEGFNTGFYLKSATVNAQFTPAVSLTLASGSISVTNVAITGAGSNTVTVTLTCTNTGTATVVGFGTSTTSSACSGTSATATLTLPTGTVVTALTTSNTAFASAPLSATPIIVGVGIMGGTITVPVNTVLALTLSPQGELVASGAGAGQTNEPLNAGSSYTLQITGVDGSTTTGSAKSS
jgi:archaeal type IV pilus assembly protein PilA